MQTKKVKKLCLIPGNTQHIGFREEQQDAFFFSDFMDIQDIEINGVLAVLADGMGGHDMGRIAASIAVATFADKYCLSEPQDTIPNRLIKAIKEANQAVGKLAVEANVDTGSTLIAAVIKDGLLFWIGTGDSRIYLWANGPLIMLTNDFIYARNLEKLLVEEHITENEAMNDPQRNYLSSYIGIRDNFNFEFCQTPVFLNQGYKILMCSDGLFGTLSEAEIAEAMNFSPQEAADLLLAKTLEKNNPYQDNVTILIIGCEAL